MVLWGERGVELGSGGDLKPETRSGGQRWWGGQLFKKIPSSSQRKLVSTMGQGWGWEEVTEGEGIKEEKTKLVASGPLLVFALFMLATERHSALKKCILSEVN